MERYELEVEGMSCGGCEQAVTNAVEKVEGVQRVDADHESGTVEVAGDEDTADRVRQAIHDAGYEPA